MKLKLVNVRCAFPVLFQPKQFNGEGDPTYSCGFLFPPTHDAHKLVVLSIGRLLKAQFKDEAQAVYKALKANLKLCIGDGDNKPDLPGYKGNLFVNARSKVRPVVLDANKAPLSEQDGKIYYGCYVDAVVEIWLQNNKWGRRANANLLGVQFRAHGERLSGGAVASESDFEAIPGAEDASQLPTDDDTPF